nr:MAG TPA: hypothetical protein [Caudoviricetes sp.]
MTVGVPVLEATPPPSSSLNKLPYCLLLSIISPAFTLANILSP